MQTQSSRPEPRPGRGLRELPTPAGGRKAGEGRGPLGRPRAEPGRRTRGPLGPGCGGDSLSLRGNGTAAPGRTATPVSAGPCWPLPQVWTGQLATRTHSAPLGGALLSRAAQPLTKEGDDALTSAQKTGHGAGTRPGAPCGWRSGAAPGLCAGPAGTHKGAGFPRWLSKAMSGSSCSPRPSPPLWTQPTPRGPVPGAGRWQGQGARHPLPGPWARRLSACPPSRARAARPTCYFEAEGAARRHACHREPGWGRRAEPSELMSIFCIKYFDN